MDLITWLYVIPLGGFVWACFYKSKHKGSCLRLASWGIESSSKEHMWSMAWDVWICAWTHGGCIEEAWGFISVHGGSKHAL